MEKEKRVEHLSRLLNEKTPARSMELYYKNTRKTLPVYEINLDYLVYNPYNGRIASYVKSFETQTGRQLNAEDEKDIKTIEGFLWESSKSQNQNTKNSLISQGQLKYGIVTKDGIIIDGNRRAMILREVAKEKSEQPVYFMAVILDENLDENPKEIMRLETTYQMGEDAKVDYNAIEKYLKCKDLRDTHHFEVDEIAKMMSESSAKIKEYLEIMKLMDEYLDSLNYSGIYTRLDLTEGAFVDIMKYLKRYEGGKSDVVKWKYDDSDVSDLRLIYFDYIQFLYNKKQKNNEDEGILNRGDGKDYRNIGKPRGIFCNESIWKSFRDDHAKEIDPIRKEFDDGVYSIDSLKEKNPEKSLDVLLRERDEEWAKKTGSILKRNLGSNIYKLEGKALENEPETLLRRALDNLNNVNENTRGFLEKPLIKELVEGIRKKAEDLKRAIKNHEKAN